MEPPLGAAPGVSPSPSTTVTTAGPAPVEETRSIRVARNGSWVDTTCPMTPADSFWHARVDSLPTVDPETPAGEGLVGFPGAGDPEDPLRLRPGLRSELGKTVTWSDSSDPLRWVRIEGGWKTESEYSAVETIQIGPFAWATGGLLRHRVPEEVLVELSSTDDHALFVDTDSCTLVEYIRWQRIPGVFSGQKATVNDLTTNERRLSARRGWLDHPTNSPDGGVIDSPRGSLDLPLIDFEIHQLEQPRKGTGASGGSAIPSSPGMVRLEEVFATPDPGDQTVEPTARIDHAITAALPWQHITGMPETPDPAGPVPFTWPATVTDGCGGTICSDGTPGSDHHVPMGSRLRLGQHRCHDDWQEPQARLLVEAMCTYGVVVTDSTDSFHIFTERDSESATPKWRRQAENELATLTLRDFELVDTTSVAAVDPAALWEEALAWAETRYGSGSALPGGWYDGTFWNAVLGCDRVAGRCTDPGLARVDAAVNDPAWYGVR